MSETPAPGPGLWGNLDYLALLLGHRPRRVSALSKSGVLGPYLKLEGRRLWKVQLVIAYQDVCINRYLIARGRHE